MKGSDGSQLESTFHSPFQSFIVTKELPLTSTWFRPIEASNSTSSVQQTNPNLTASANVEHQQSSAELSTKFSTAMQPSLISSHFQTASHSPFTITKSPPEETFAIQTVNPNDGIYTDGSQTDSSAVLQTTIAVMPSSGAETPRSPFDTDDANNQKTTEDNLLSLATSGKPDWDFDRTVVTSELETPNVDDGSAFPGINGENPEDESGLTEGHILPSHESGLNVGHRPREPIESAFPSTIGPATTEFVISPDSTLTDLQATYLTHPDTMLTSGAGKETATSGIYITHPDKMLPSEIAEETTAESISFPEPSITYPVTALTTENGAIDAEVPTVTNPEKSESSLEHVASVQETVSIAVVSTESASKSSESTELNATQPPSINNDSVSSTTETVESHETATVERLATEPVTSTTLTALSIEHSNQATSTSLSAQSFDSLTHGSSSGFENEKQLAEMACRLSDTRPIWSIICDLSKTAQPIKKHRS
ncbi:unnamed protein product [Anisakis simplex]|uniref:Receptor-type tyrosine-protein phosphatase zeta n=1 Tax=Anisakis simplex TaxID=6269 RepID=A0A0M3KAM2_ANISI|nr:unnamed protein product [Anisakis simplex]